RSTATAIERSLARAANGTMWSVTLSRRRPLSSAGSLRRSHRGWGFCRIAKRLNAEGVPCIAGSRGWAQGAVREIVLRDLYRGRLVWGRTRWVDRGGTKVKEDRPESEWLVLDQPALSIIPEELWQRARARLDVTRTQYKRMVGGKLVGQPAYVTHKPYLLSTLLECAVCGGPVRATKRTGQRAQPRYYYICTTHRVRGDRLCANALAAPMARLDAAVVAGMARKVLTPHLVDDVVRHAVEIRPAPHPHPPPPPP